MEAGAGSLTVDGSRGSRFSISRMSDYAAANVRPTRLSGQREIAMPATINTVTPMHVQVYTDRRSKNALDIP